MDYYKKSRKKIKRIKKFNKIIAAHLKLNKKFTKLLNKS